MGTRVGGVGGGGATAEVRNRNRKPKHAGFTHHDPAVAAANDNDPEAEAERERLAAVQRALNGDNPYQDLLDQGINPADNPAFFGVPRPVPVRDWRTLLRENPGVNPPEHC